MNTGSLFSALVLAVACGTVLAQAPPFPQRPIRLVVPVPPGGSIDAVARLIAPKMAESLGQPVVIDNRAGASTNIGMELVARAAGDGYTVLANTIPLVANPALFRNMPINPGKDFAPVSLVINGPSVIVTNPALPVRTVPELIALANAKAGLVKYSSVGPGTLTHLGAELFKYFSRVEMMHVPYKGAGAALSAVMSGECDVSFQTPLAASGQIAAGKLRAIAVTSTKRLPMLPDVPTVAESGVPRYEFQTWVGLVAPIATPSAIVKILNEHAVRAARAPDVAERFARDGAEVIASSPEDFRRQMAGETQLWARVISEMGIKAE